MRQDDVRRERDQFRRVSANFVGLAGGPARLDPRVAADAPAQQRQPLQERPDANLEFRIIRSSRQKYPDAARGLALLRARRERPRRRRAAEQRDELAPLHSITSSARASSEGGTSRPSALAVLRLMNSSTFVDCWTGRSAGFSPLRTLPV